MSLTRSLCGGPLLWAGAALFMAGAAGGCSSKEEAAGASGSGVLSSAAAKDAPSAAGTTAGAEPSSSPNGANGASSTSEPSDAGANAEPQGKKAGEIVLVDEELYPATLDEQREALFRRMAAAMTLDAAAMDRVKAVFATSKVMGQGNPKMTRYPMTRKECREKREAASLVEVEHAVCGAPFMVPVYGDSSAHNDSEAKLCVDKYEFPGIPCEHPVVWVSSKDAEDLCSAVGKRLCDTHEWEGACAGAVHTPEQDYAFGKSRHDMRRLHNQDREIVWSYGPAKDHKKCGTMSKKNKSCTSSGFKTCGSNTYPAGSFPECKSPFDVFDLHGNVAEHMNFPMKPAELLSAGGSGQTEMKGSWFIFSTYEAHPDDCRWRAPDWHVTALMSRNSHANYHLGFRCCKDVSP